MSATSALRPTGTCSVPPDRRDQVAQGQHDRRSSRHRLEAARRESDGRVVALAQRRAWSSAGRASRGSGSRRPTRRLCHAGGRTIRIRGVAIPESGTSIGRAGWRRPRPATSTRATLDPTSQRNRRELVEGGAPPGLGMAAAGRIRPVAERHARLAPWSWSAPAAHSLSHPARARRAGARIHAPDAGDRAAARARPRRRPPAAALRRRLFISRRESCAPTPPRSCSTRRASCCSRWLRSRPSATSSSACRGRPRSCWARSSARRI